MAAVAAAGEPAGAGAGASAGAAAPLSLPQALAALLPRRRLSWEADLGICKLRVNPSGEVGLDLKISEFGYLVEQVHADPGQDARIQNGLVIISLNGVSLVKLDEDTLETVFGSNICEGAAVLLLPEDELVEAAGREGDSGECSSGGEELKDREVMVDMMQDVVLEHGNVIMVPACSAQKFLAMESAMRNTLSSALAALAERLEIRAELCCAEGAHFASVALSGIPEDVEGARSQVHSLLGRYGLGAQSGRLSPESAAELWPVPPKRPITT